MSRPRHWGDYCRGLFFLRLTTYAEAEIVLRCAICIGNSDRLIDIVRAEAAQYLWLRICFPPPSLGASVPSSIHYIIPHPLLYVSSALSTLSRLMQLLW